MTIHQSYILLVDDDASNLFLLEELLQAEGYQTRSVQSGSQALSLAQDAPPGLVLLDVMMPDMDGFEVCQQLRIDPVLQTVPVIFLTALDDDDSRLKGLELMGDDYLTKPIHSQLVLAKVASILRLSQLRSQHSQQLIYQQARQWSENQVAAAWQISEALSEKFRLFVPEQLLCRIAPQGVESIQLGNATEEEITVLFCDIREFTAIAESQQAKETFEWLNAFFTRMNQAIVSHHGFIDKYLGDAIMAVFDRPQHHAQDAIGAAVVMRQTLIDFNTNRALFNLEHPINIGIGIHTGQGVIGTLGSDYRMDSTVIGDVVNTASRLEDLTKQYGCQVIASGAAIAQLSQPDLFQFRWIDRVTPRGKQQANDLYEILGTHPLPIDQAKVQSQATFEQGIQAWHRGHFSTALEYFQQVVAQNAKDTVATLYIQRCQQQLG
jgi:two-component system sensor histidine kinase ChiS